MAQVKQPAGGDAQRVHRPLRAEMRRHQQAERAAGERGAFGQGAPAHGAAAAAQGGSQNAAQRDAFGQFVQRHRQGNGHAQSQGRGGLDRGDAPAIQKGMQGGSGDQRSGEAMELARAGIVVVIVRAGGADRIGEAVDGEEQPISGGEQEAAGEPAGLCREFRKQSEKGHAQQHARADRYHHLDALTQPREP